MNISGIFIRRPVMTTLVMAAILLFGVIGYRLLPVSDLPNVDFPTIQVSAEPARREPRDDGLGGGDAAGEAVLDHRRHRLDDLDERAWGYTQITLQFSLEPRHRRRRPGRAGGHRRAPPRQLPPDMPTPPSYQKVNPADQPILYLALTSPTLPLSTLNEYAETLHGPAHLDGQRRGAGAGLRLAEVRGARPARPAARWPPRGIGIDEVATAVADGEREPADRHALRARRRPSPSRPTASSTNADALPAARSWPTATARRCASRTSGGCIDSVENDKIAALVQRRQRAASCWPSSASPAPTRSRWSTRSRRCCPRFRAAAAGLGEAGDPVRPLGVHPRVGARRAVHAAARRWLLVVLVIFLFLRNLSATIIPSLALPHVDHRHVRGHVPVSATASTTSRSWR